MYIVDELKNTLLSWEEEIIRNSFGENIEECYEEYEIIRERINKIKTIDGLIRYFMEGLSYMNSIKTLNDLMFDTISLKN